jgi:cell division protein FtsB
LNWDLVIITIMILLALLQAQQKHYEFIQAQDEAVDLKLLNEDIEKKLKEFDEYKKRVDTLTVRAGFNKV